MITDADIDKLKQVFATKDDLDRFATKDDLKRFATKVDLSEMELRMTKTIVNAIVEVYEVIGKQDDELKPYKREQGAQRLAIKDHEIRIEHLEHPTL